MLPRSAPRHAQLANFVEHFEAMGAELGGKLVGTRAAGTPRVIVRRRANADAMTDAVAMAAGPVQP